MGAQQHEQRVLSYGPVSRCFNPLIGTLLVKARNLVQIMEQFS
ncbi:septum formation initiator [Acetobacter orientalis]|uniref:Septum formation initiator n=1 Tax=Acetobacter orientalis TaxID=146474 RepID=A0A2Z5ZDY7_9PROT|nr:septum formation initiator [Acetobacter orientalis]